jgi:GNAT superfamily N-acetyltransferase
VYRVVPRTWALTWLAGAHRDAPEVTDPDWRSRWARDALRYDQSPPPKRFADPPNAGLPVSDYQLLAESRSLETLAEVRSTVLPRLLLMAEERGWWDPLAVVPPHGDLVPGDADAIPAIIPNLDHDLLDRLVLAPRTLPPADPESARRLLAAALQGGARASGAVAGDQLVGVALSAPGAGQGDPTDVLWIGVAPGNRRRGLGTALVAALVAGPDASATRTRYAARLGVAERDVVEPLPFDDRLAIAARVLARSGFRADPRGGGSWSRD